MPDHKPPYRSTPLDEAYKTIYDFMEEELPENPRPMSETWDARYYLLHALDTLNLAIISYRKSKAEEAAKEAKEAKKGR